MNVTVSNASAVIGEKSLFKNVFFQACAGDSILIKGASGLGKTTFLHLLAGLLPPAEGKILLGDVNIAALNEERRCIFRRNNIGVVFQKLNLIEYLTPVENIQLGVKGFLP